MDVERKVKRRESSEIIVQLLKAAAVRSGVTKTQLVYKSNLNFTRCERYIELLMKKDMLENIDVDSKLPKMFRITPKGKEALKLLSSASEFLFSGAEQFRNEDYFSDFNEDGNSKTEDEELARTIGILS